MSNFDTTYVADLSLEDCRSLMQHMLNNSDWKISQIDDSHFTLKEPRSIIGTLATGASSYPAQIEVTIQAEQGRTCFVIHGSNFGIGPIQSHHVKSEVNEFLSTVQGLIRGTQNMRREIENKLNQGVLCPTCGNAISPGTRFCPHDGTPIARECAKCGSSNMPGAQFCSNCGAAL